MQFINNAPFSRVAVLVPFIGYWIIFNDHFVKQFAELWSELGGASPRPWRLLVTYFGLCFVGVGSGLYHMFCPPELKRYPGATDYVAAIAPHMSRIEEGRVRDALAKGDADSMKLHAEIGELLKTLPSPRNDVEFYARNQEVRREILQAHFDLCNRSWFPARVAAFTLFAAGTIILLIPAGDIFVRVARVLIGGP
jgi:hypothetical protein